MYMNIFELFDRPTEYKVEANDFGATVEFEIDGAKYIGSINSPQPHSPYARYEVQFRRLDGDYDERGTGNAFSVFSTMHSFVMDYVKKNKERIYELDFSALDTDPTRMSMYKRLADKIAKDTGWPMRTEQSGFSSYLHYIFKVSPSEFE